MALYLYNNVKAHDCFSCTGNLMEYSKKLTIVNNPTVLIKLCVIDPTACQCHTVTTLTLWKTHQNTLSNVVQNTNYICLHIQSLLGYICTLQLFH